MFANSIWNYAGMPTITVTYATYTKRTLLKVTLIYFYSALRQTTSGSTSKLPQALSVLQDHRPRRRSRNQDGLWISCLTVFSHAGNTSFKRQQLTSGAREYLWTGEPHRAGFKQVREKILLFDLLLQILNRRFRSLTVSFFLPLPPFLCHHPLPSPPPPHAPSLSLP